MAMTIQNRHSSHAAVLVIDSDPLMLTALAATLDMHGYRAILARNEAIAHQALANEPIDLIVLSINQLEEGCDFAERLRSGSQSHDLPIIFLAPELSQTWTDSLQSHGGVTCMLKPIDPHALVEFVEKALWMPHLAQRRIRPPAAHLGRVADWVRLQ